MRILFYIVIILLVIAAVRQFLLKAGQKGRVQKPGFRPRAKGDRGMWVQVYDTDSLNEVQRLQAQLEEEELDCFIYEQGRKDIHGNLLKGFGIAVPRTSVSLAQKIIARMPA